MKLFKHALGLCVLGLLTIACSDDDTIPRITTPETTVKAPINYSFERNGAPTVSFSGQTTRIAMAEVLASTLKTPSASKEQLAAIFDHKKDETNFDDTALNSSSKSVKSKVAASKDFFALDAVASAAVKEDFDTWIAAQVTDVFPNWDIEAVAGSPGKIQEAGGGSTRYVNAKGLEYNQAIAKGLIGALMTDQALNNYLGTAVLDGDGNLEDNDAGIIAEDKNYTTMEHKWDETYGYIYGASQDVTDPNATLGKDDSFLNKYLGRVEGDDDFKGIATTIHDAFKLGRAAIVAKNYDVRNAQAAIIRKEISKVIGVRAVYYLQQGKNNLNKEVKDFGSAFHDLSEGYGFIYSLQFTRKPGTSTPYLTRAEVTNLLDQLMAGTNGLWDVTPATLDEISEFIAAKFDFTVDEAGS